MIVPPKAEITKAEAADHSIRLAFTDDRPIGATGYEVEYRKAGDVGWTMERVAEGAAEHTIKGLDGSASYEVRVRSYVTVPTILQVELDYYGEYSDTLTVAVP